MTQVDALRALQDAQDALVSRARLAERVGDWRESRRAELLAAVADCLGRLTLPTASPHYRAEKSVALLYAVMPQLDEAMRAFAGWANSVSFELAEGNRRYVQDAITRVLVADMWRTAQAGGSSGLVFESDANACAAARRFYAWAEAIGQRAVSDEVAER